MPCYILDEGRLRRNLDTIRSIAADAGVDIILAFKAYALWKTFPIFRQYINATTASSLCEARLATEEFGSPAHTFSPAYTDDEIDTIARCSSHLTFNSLTQYQRYHRRVTAANPGISLGLRINPEYSEVATLLYNPCAPGSRFGITAAQLSPFNFHLSTIEGFHCHCLCESGADVFRRTLQHIEHRFGQWLPQLKWINLGGGLLMTRQGFDRTLLVDTLQDFHRRYPNLKVYLEPGSAFAWETGCLVAQVVDIVEHSNIRTAILNVSFTCHMPDCLEMPYRPQVKGAVITDDNSAPHTYRLGGCSCLAGDFVGNYSFANELNVGDDIVFEDMLHYTTVKTTMFNGCSHPDIALRRPDGSLQLLRHYSYEDYKQRMD